MDFYGRILGFLDRSRYYSFQVAPQLYSRGWVDPVPEPLLLWKSSSYGNRTLYPWICSQEFWPLDLRGGPWEAHSLVKQYMSTDNWRRSFSETKRFSGTRRKRNWRQNWALRVAGYQSKHQDKVSHHKKPVHNEAQPPGRPLTYINITVCHERFASDVSWHANIWVRYVWSMPITEAARTLRFVRSNPTKVMDVFVCLFSVVLRVGKGFVTGWSPAQGVLPTSYRIKELKKSGQGSTKGL
jgi:hypothetical protein